MAFKSGRFEKVKQAKNEFNKLFDDKAKCYLIHYSCESWVDNVAASHRVTSIAIRHLETAQTESFSIFQSAEKLKIPADQIIANYNKVEKQLLDDYFKFIKKNKTHKFIHWNMRDINYGFKALEHRFKVLKGSPYILEDEKKFDLSRMLIDLFSVHYINHPRMINIIKYNHISTIDLLTGKEEADAFNAGEYMKLHKSTLRKIDCFESLLTRVEEGKFKNMSSAIQKYGVTPKALMDLADKNLATRLVMILSAFYGFYEIIMKIISHSK